MSARVFIAFFVREFRAALVGRSVHIFWTLALVAGLNPVWRAREGTEGYLILQCGLYLIPLFALLLGIGSAQNESEERAFLMSQPIDSASRVLGKFLALWTMALVAVGLVIAPTVLTNVGLAGLAFLGVQISAIAGIFSALGLAVGFSTIDRLRAFLSGLCVWLALLVGTGLLALAAAHSGLAREKPDLWIALLMGNPLDSLRIGVLLELGQIPFEADALPPLGRWWLAHPGRWYGVLSLLWITLSLLWAGFCLQRRKV
jgi:ABC-2 type transport system permease protein/Cu-processing system permease protein